VRTRPRILLDVDGVLADYLAAVLPLVLAVTGRRYAHADVVQWDFAKALGLSDDETERVHALTREPGFCAGIPVLPGAPEGVRALRGHADVYFTTSPTHGLHWYYERTEWLVRHFDASVEHVLHVKHKEVVAGDVIVDDKPEHVVEWYRHHPGGHAVLWDQLYNRGWHMPGGHLTRGTDWNHVLGRVGEVERQRAIRDVGVK